MAQSQLDTMETQELIHKRRVQRFCVTKGVDRGELIDRVNVVSEPKKPLKRKKESTESSQVKQST